MIQTVGETRVRESALLRFLGHGLPVGPGFRNPGATDMHIHGVTIIGVSAIAAMAILAVIAAYDQGVREHR